jgi:hypothetical protein
LDRLFPLGGGHEVIAKVASHHDEVIAIGPASFPNPVFAPERGGSLDDEEAGFLELFGVGLQTIGGTAEFLS